MSLWLYAKKPNIQAGSLTADGLSCHKLAFVIQLFLFYFISFYFILFPKNPFECSSNNSVDAVHHKYISGILIGTNSAVPLSVSYILTSLIFRYCQ